MKLYGSSYCFVLCTYMSLIISTAAISTQRRILCICKLLKCFLKEENVIQIYIIHVHVMQFKYK